jgi:poly-gamma-glutamate capsule biosynthesis protein CapA/YwtB (metallophosphatase superfamily)
MTRPAELPFAQPQQRKTMRCFLSGDVMTGRGIDQVLAHPCNPVLYESHVHSAIDYVRLAEAANGPIPRHVVPAYVWGAALDELDRAQPDARIINLETSITRSKDYAHKGINYRMSPENADCLVAAAIDCCVLANNHVLDWGKAGLLETLATLEHFGIKTAGAGGNCGQASAPAVLDIADKGRLLVFSFADATSGTPHDWTATSETPGVNLLADLSEQSIARVAEQIAHVRQPRDVVIVSIHCGPNWGYEIPEEQRYFAHTLIDKADVSIIHGHSSHHAKAIEVYRNRLILYGCGDFLNDYEGIRGYEDYRDDLALMYFAEIDPASRDLAALEIVPLQIRQFRLARPSNEDLDWVCRTLNRESQRLGARVGPAPEGRLALSWMTHFDRYSPYRLNENEREDNGRAIGAREQREIHMKAAMVGQSSSNVPKRRQKHLSYDESVDESAKLIEEEAVEIEQELPAEENEPLESIEETQIPDTPAFEE